MHPAPIGTKDQKIHSGQFNTKVLFPFLKLSDYLVHSVFEKDDAEDDAQDRDQDYGRFLQFLWKAVCDQCQADQFSFAAGQCGCQQGDEYEYRYYKFFCEGPGTVDDLRENTFPTVSTRISSVEITRTIFSTAASAFMIFL